MAEDLIVADGNFQFASKTIRNYGNFLNIHLGAYEWVLNEVINTAIQDEQITARIQKLLENLSGIKEAIKIATDTIGQYSIEFVEAVDEADKFLYGNE